MRRARQQAYLTARRDSDGKVVFVIRPDGRVAAIAPPPSVGNKRLVARLFEVYNDHDLDAFVECYADDAYIHGAGEDFDGIERVRSFASGQFDAFPDGTYEIEDVNAEDDRVVVRMTFTGTHNRPFFGVAHSGEEITVTEIGVYRLADREITEMWLEADLWGMFRQIGAVEQPAA